MNRLKSSPEDSNDYHQGDNQPGATAPWIEDFLGRQKSIHVVYHLLEKIDDEVQRNGGKFPDVELLPNVDLSLMKDETDQMGEGEAKEKKRIRVGEHRSPGKRVKSTNESPSSPAMMRRSSRFPATPPM